MRNRIYRITVLCLFALFCVITSNAQSITINGSIKNVITHEGVPAVSVQVKNSNDGTFTNSNGDFSIKAKKLPVVLLVSSIGYDAQEITITDAKTGLNIDFKPNTSMAQEVVLSATRTPQRILESPVTVERYSSTALKNIAAPSYYDAITNLKGVDMHTAGLLFKTVTTRGFVASGNTRLNQLIDGMDNQAPGLNFSVGSVIGLTELDVDNIELLAGASSALYGSGGMNGTLLINSKSPFKYQGVSFNIKQGMMHVDENYHGVSPYYDWTGRWAKAYNNKFAIKLSGQLIKANDWQAEDYRNKQQIGILSTIVGGNRSNDPNYNGVNIYGDETSANMASFAGLVQAQTRSGILSATGGGIDVVSLLNAYYTAIGNPTYPTNAQVAGFYTFAGFPPALQAALQSSAIQSSVNNMLPFYIGLRNNYFGNYNVSRTGYEEKYLVDYNTINFKFNIGLYYKITPGIEVSFNSYLGTGTTVYTGADRYSLKNLKMGQHKLEFKAKNWMLRGYTTQENAGDSYNSSALGALINESWKPSSSWFPQYIGTYSEMRRQLGTSISDIQLHTASRSAADVGRLLPGTTAFDAVANQIKSTPIKNGGALFLDKSDLWVAEGQVNISEAAGFSKIVDVMVGVQWKQYVLNSQGTLFSDTTGNIRINEYGAFVQLRKKLFNDFLTLTASGRWDKNENFQGKFTPRFTAVIKLAKDNNLRFSYQTAYRFPSNQNQYISLVTGAGTLIGCLPQFQTYYNLVANPGYTPESIVAYRNSGNPANTNLLVKTNYSTVKPESMSSYEVGYKGIIAKRLLIDAYYYFSNFQNFLATIGVGQGKSGAITDLYSPFTTTNVSYVQNSTNTIKSNGWGFGLDYNLVKNFFIYGNIYSDMLSKVPVGLVTFFNAPKYRFNIGARNDNVYKNIGFNIVAKYQDNNYYEGTFVTGTLPYFTWVDAQISYHPPKTKSLFRVGGTNIGNKYYRTGVGSPAVGGLYYVSYGYNL